MINRSNLGKIKVTLSINFDVYNIILFLNDKRDGSYYYFIREGPIDGTSDGPVKD